MKRKPSLKEPECPSCGCYLMTHDDLESTCAELQEMKARLDSITTLVRTLRMDKDVRDYLLDVADGKK